MLNLKIDSIMYFKQKTDYLTDSEFFSVFEPIFGKDGILTFVELARFIYEYDADKFCAGHANYLIVKGREEEKNEHL